MRSAPAAITSKHINHLLSSELTVLLDFVLCLQVAGHLATLKGIAAACCDLHACAGLALAFKLEDSKVVALAEHISGRLSKV